MRKKLAATVCVFAGVIISASLLIVSVLAATSASATITASVSYTPAIQAKVWLNDGKNDMLIFNNKDATALYSNGNISVTSDANGIKLNNYSAPNGTTFTITVENYSTGINHQTTGNKIYLGLKVGGTSNSITGSPPAELEGDKFVTTTFNTSVTAFAANHTYAGYSYLNRQIETNGGTGTITFTPEIVVPGTLELNILLFDAL